MHLLSATVRNYRIHRELKIAFDSSLTLISGANESGKSTLAEAIHRALFFRANAGGQVREQMLSLLHSGPPEVELHFVAGGREYHLVKRFSGPNGTVRLTESGGQTLHGDAAETRLADLLGVGEMIGGHGAVNKLAQQWSHLWVWQGKSGEDPCQHVGAEHQALLNRLQQDGGAAVMQSECDSRVAASVSKAAAAIFNQSGKAKKGSDLEKAEAALAAAEANRAQAAERVQRLRQAVRDFEEASRRIEQTSADLKQLEKDRADVTTKIKEVDTLRNLEKLQKMEADKATGEHDALSQRHEEISGLTRAIADGETAATPKKTELARLETVLAEARRELEKSETDYSKACEGTRGIRLRRDWAATAISFFEKKAAHEELRHKATEIEKRQQSVMELRKDLAKLPAIDERMVKKLQDLENQVDRATASLKAMAAGIEILASEGPVLIGETTFAAGQSEVVTETTEIVFGDSLRLRIRPGGGERLTEARRTLAEARETRQKFLDELGVADLTSASEAASQRSHLQKQIDQEESALRAMDADRIPGLLTAAQENLTAAEAELTRRASPLTDLQEPADIAEAKLQLNDLETALHTADSAETEARLKRDAAAKAMQESEAKRDQLRDAVKTETDEGERLKMKRQLLVQAHGDDSSRKQKLEALLADRKEKESALGKTTAALAALQPDQLTRLRERLERSWGNAEKERQDARDKRVGASTILRSDGSEDPEAELAVADARLESAQRHHKSVQRKAEAIALLDELFSDEKRALADRFTRPLVEKIGGYLQCVFGPDSRAAMALGERAFTAVQLVRGGNGSGAMPFENLSGGAREQVAAAARLAMAEVLAGEHGGCLPVIFDDAFAWSDPERTKTLQDMLDLAASRGLQLIVLTCNPTDYITLGARQIRLPAPDPALGTALQSRIAAPASGSETTDHSQFQPTTDPHAQPPVTEKQRQQFLAALQAAGGKSGNQSLNTTLGWDDATYDAVKEDLLASGEIVPGRGRGGSVALLRDVSDERVRI